ncbi:hypothetical protein [Bacteriovorax sp. BAL6_X]|uniref:hypothetical protein n=1 Tax=Bacteriovorax sp. BAL6_X TaxID=1201290 RepID=UPI0005906406|nr:hypothetical protein [Bacteriovorax sp. BAL6_X]
MMNIWALKDRALFSVNGQIYFGRNINELLKAYHQSVCLIGKDNYIQKLSGLSSRLEQVKIGPRHFVASEKDLVLRALILSKSLNLENEYMDNPKLGKCKVSKDLVGKVYEIYNTNKELKKRYNSFVESNKLDTSSSQFTEYKDFVFKNISSRLFL